MAKNVYANNNVAERPRNLRKQLFYVRNIRDKMHYMIYMARRGEERRARET